MKKIAFLILLLFSLPSFGEISCSLEKLGCITAKGILTSKTFHDKHTILYLNGIEIKKLITSDVDNAFAYYDVTYDSVFKKKRQKPSRLILSYVDDYGCISDIDKIRCKKIFVVDLSKDRPIISNEITTPVRDSMMMYVDWENDSVIMRFEDHSKFIYKNGEIKMLDDGHLLRQAERDEENSFKDKNNDPEPPTQSANGITTVLGKLDFYGNEEGNTDVELNGKIFFTINGDFYNGLFINPIMNNEADEDKLITRMVIYASILKECQYPNDFTQCHVFYLFDFSGDLPVGVGPMRTTDPDAALLLTKWNKNAKTEIGFSDGTTYEYMQGKLNKIKEGLKK